MKVSDKRNKRLMTILALELVLLVMVAVALDSASKPAFSGIGNYTVVGYVTDSAGRPADGADVAVTIVQTSTTLHCTTGPDGFYQVEFLESEWNDNDDINVVATLGGQAVETGVCDQDTTYSQIDVQFAFEIPEFGSLMGSMVVIAALALMALLFVWKRPR